jgi:hypothetical protein
MENVNTAKCKFRHTGTPSRYGRYGKYGVSNLAHLTNGETLASFLVQILTKPLFSLKGSVAIK